MQTKKEKTHTIREYNLDKSGVLERVKLFFELKSNAELARFMGVSPNTITNWYSRNTFDIDKIYTNCVGVDLNWLLTGDEKMLNPANPIDIGGGSTDVKYLNQDIPIATPATSHLEGIPLIPFSAMAGAMSGEMKAMEYECERYVIPAFKGAEFLIPVKGSSMYPKYSSGDIVACKRVAMSDIFFQWGKVYVLDTEQGPLIKRIKPTEDPSQLLILSDNPSYDPFRLPLTSVYSVALVIGVIRLE